MEIRIHELLNGYEDSSVPMEETDVVSAMRIKVLTEMKIEQIETQYKHTHTHTRYSKHTEEPNQTYSDNSWEISLSNMSFFSLSF